MKIACFNPLSRTRKKDKGGIELAYWKGLQFSKNDLEIIN